MRARLLVVSLTLVAGCGPSASADVLVTGDRVSLSVRAMPANAVLDRLARATGMSITYEGGAPRALVTVERDSMTPSEALLAVIEGLGLNYAMIMDREGTKVEAVVILGGSSGARAGAPPPASGPAMRRGPVPEPVEEPEHQEPPTDDEEQPSSTVDHPEDRVEAPESANVPQERPAEARPMPQFGPLTPGGAVNPAPVAMPTPLPWPGASPIAPPGAAPVPPARKPPDDNS